MRQRLCAASIVQDAAKRCRWSQRWGTLLRMSVERVIQDHRCALKIDNQTRWFEDKWEDAGGRHEEEGMSRDLHVTSPMMRGADIYGVQKRLRDLGYAVGDLD